MMHDGIWNIIEESECLFTETAGDQNNLGFHNITKIALIWSTFSSRLADQDIIDVNYNNAAEHVMEYCSPSNWVTHPHC